MDKIEEIRHILAEKTNTDQIDDNLSLKELGLDSLDVVDMCLSLEEKYGVTFETEELSGLKTVGDLFAVLGKKLDSAK